MVILPPFSAHSRAKSHDEKPAAARAIATTTRMMVRTGRMISLKFIPEYYNTLRVSATQSSNNLTM